MTQSTADSTKDVRDEDRRRNQSFEHPWIDSKTQVRLLNITDASPESFACTFEIFPISALANTHYCALSYTWGEAQSTADVRPIIVDNQRFYVRTNLWEFFAQCSTLTQGVPIFIDAICLNQLDIRERSDQIGFMPEIYQNANITHLWLGKPYKEVQRNLECFQFEIDRGTPTALWKDESIIGLSYVCSRKYWQRLWAVQELLFSENISIHCGSINFQWDSLERLARLPLADSCLDHSRPTAFWSNWAIDRPQQFSQQQALEDDLFQGWRYASSLIHHRFIWRRTRLFGADGHRSKEAQGFPLHRAAQYFKYQQCRDAYDKIFALLGLLDDDGRQMIECNYNMKEEDMFVQVAAAGFVSRWKYEPRTQAIPTPSFEDSMFCTTICDILGFPSHLPRTHMPQALGIAGLYITGFQKDNMELSSSTSHRDGERHKSAGGIAEIAPFMFVNATQEMDVSPFQQTFRDFCHRFDAYVDEFVLTDATQLKHTIAVIQMRQRKERNIKNLSRIEPLLEALGTYSMDLDSALGQQNIITFIWGPMKLLLETTRISDSAFDGLLLLYQRLGESMPAYAYVNRLDDTVKKSNVMGEVFCKVFEFNALALAYFLKPAWKLLLRSTWDLLQARLNEHISAISRLKLELEKEVNTPELEQHRQERSEQRARTRGLLEQARQMRSENEAEYHRLNYEEVLRRRLFLLNWLSAADASADQEYQCSLRASNPNSGQWLAKHSTFKSWLEPTSDFENALWITGIPGAGKSVLASLIVEECSSIVESLTVYFYCKQGDPRKNTFVGMARSILHQLLQADDTLVVHLFKLAIKRGERNLNTNRSAIEALDACLKAAGKMHVIIDGIDKCQREEQKRIADFWLKYAQESSSEADPSRCVMISQDDEITRPLFGALPIVCVQGLGHEQDIHSYCVQRAIGIEQQFGLSREESTSIALKAFNRANGMFLFAHLLLENLSNQTSKLEINEEMATDTFPTRLIEVYERLINRILRRAPDSISKRAKRVLAWITCAVRPLKWREIQAAASFDTAEETFDFEGRHLNVGMKTLCGALVEEQSNGDITFVHWTVKRYLLTYGVVDAAHEQASLTELCLSYLSMPAFSSNLSSDEIKNYAGVGTYAFMEYAIISWTAHLEQVLELSAVHDLPQSVITTLAKFFSSHWKAPSKRSRPTKYTRKLTDQIKYLGFLHDQISDSISAMRFLLNNNLQNSERVETLDLFESIKRIRFQIEVGASETQVLRDLEIYYGKQLFKCPRIHCKWYHEGFTGPELRELHVQKHERAHFCPNTSCLFATLGYPTVKELEKHVKEAHAEGPTDDDFPEPVEQIQDTVTPPISVDEPCVSAEPEIEVGERTSLTAVSDREPVNQIQDSEGAQPESVSVDNTVDAEPQRTPSDDTSDDCLETAMTLNELLNGSTLEQFLAGGVKAKRSHPSTSKSQTDSGSARATAVPQQPSRMFQCELCPKQFTRHHDLNNHLRSHADERPYACEVCSKKYARLNDMRRHLASHSRKFICGGTLDSGVRWGCNHRFGRRDGLKRHFQSKTGSACIQPILEAEASKKMEAGKAELISHQVNPPFTTRTEPQVQSSSQFTTMLSDVASVELARQGFSPADPQSQTAPIASTIKVPHLDLAVHKASKQTYNELKSSEMLNGPIMPASLRAFPTKAGMQRRVHDSKISKDFVNSLGLSFFTQELFTLYASAIRDPNIGTSRLRTSILHSMARCIATLNAEKDGYSDNRNFMKLMRSRSIIRSAARLIIHQTRASQLLREETTLKDADADFNTSSLVTFTHDSESDGSTESSFDEADSNSDYEVCNFGAVQNYIVNSHAFLQFKMQVLEFVHSPYRDRVLRSLGPELSEKRGLGESVINTLIQEISWVPPSIFRFCEREEFQISNSIKAFFEGMTNKAWDWWPLAPRIHQVPAGCSRIKWTTPCGHIRSMDVAHEAARAFQAALLTAPKFLEMEGISGRAAGQSSNTTTKSPLHGQHLPFSKISNSSHQKNLHNPQSNRQQSTSSPSIQLQQMPPTVNSNVIPVLISGSYVYLCIRISNGHKFVELCGEDLKTDVAFFSSVRRQYFTARGHFSRYFSFASWWRYDHCEFHQFLKYATGSSPLGEGFPPEADNDYDFDPRPIAPQPPHGPISKTEFAEHFYTYCDECCHRWHQEQMRRWAPSLADAEVIKALPKRKTALEMQDGKRAIFWGLIVREKRSDLIVLIYVVLCNIPGLLFFFLWLLYWGHDSDLQNASVPALTSLSITIGFVAWLYSTPQGGLR